MFNQKFNLGIMGGILAFGLILSTQAMAAFTAEKAAELDVEAKATLDKFIADTKGSADVFANAKGVLVCPKIYKAGLGIGGEHGKCVLTSGYTSHLYYGNSGFKAGWIAGIESHSMILVMNTDEAVAKFTSDKREWELGVDAEVAVAKVGATGELDTTNMKKDVVSFIFGEKGLIANATWGGSRFKKLDVK